MLPNGKEELIPAKLGQTVQYTKAVLHEQFDLPMDKQVAAAQAWFIATWTKLLGSHGESLQKLICEGRAMLDPLSLVDCKGISSSGLNLIQVQVVEAHWNMHVTRYCHAHLHWPTVRLCCSSFK